MTLVLDRRQALQGEPGLHVFIAGVSAYPHLPATNSEPLRPEHYGLRQLSSTSLAAYKLYRWLEDHKDDPGLPVKLASIRLLLSPSPLEIEQEPVIAGVAEPCTLELFQSEAKQWRDDAKTHKQNMTLFYFAGHGAQHGREDAVILMQGFGNLNIDNPMAQAVNIQNIYYGMAPSDSQPNIAQTQIYIIDACRDFLEAFRKYELGQPPGVFRVGRTGEDRRSAPIFLAAVPGTRALGLRGDQTLFSKALIECLEGEAADLREELDPERWVISVQTLTTALALKIDNLNKNLPAHVQPQEFILAGQIRDTVLRYLAEPPSVELVIEVDPASAVAVAAVEILDELGRQIPGVPIPLQPHPYSRGVPALTRVCNGRVGYPA